MSEFKQLPTLVYFYAPWCGPCKTMGPVVEQISGAMNVGVQKINVDTEPELAQKYGVRSIPTFILEDRDAGVELLRIVGAKPGTTLEFRIEQALKARCGVEQSGSSSAS